MAKFCFVSVHVDDLEKAKDFYVNTLGFQARDVPAGPGVVPLIGEGMSPVLIEVPEANRSEYATSSQIVVGVETADIASTYADYKAKGVDFLEDGPEPFPVGQRAHFRDPAGNVLELIQWS